MQVGIIKMTDEILVFLNVSQKYRLKTEKRKFLCRSWAGAVSWEVHY